MQSRNLTDITGIAERLGVTERHVRRLVFERRIPFIKWGHLLRFDPDEIDRWVDDARVDVIRASYDATASSARTPAGPLTTSSRRTS